MRLFIAIDFNEIKDNLKETQSNIDISLANLKQTSEFHLTLKFLGDVEEKDTQIIKEKLNQIKFKKFQLKLDNIGTFPDENYIRVIWIGVNPKGQVIELQEQINQQLEEFNFKKDFKFHPHITLARVNSITNKETFKENLKDIIPKQKTIEVTNFKLIKSTLTKGGPIYEDIAIFSSEF
jgi:2'-5' RNA ligase